MNKLFEFFGLDQRDVNCGVPVPLGDVGCPECRYRTTYKVHHSPTCSRITLEAALFYIDKMREHDRAAEAKAVMFSNETQRWEAKFRQVKHENNQLRKRCEGQAKALALIEGVKKAHAPGPQP